MNAVELSKMSSSRQAPLQVRSRLQSEMLSATDHQSQLTAGGNYSRKEKSLGELCRRFLLIYGKQSQDFLLLDQCTEKLEVERRRIYDIINILESFSVIQRAAKNSY